ncbi:MAG: hypothetical protein KGZ59_03550 [Chitinophagaceae bacterium]|nr:hypothetical protein [Chitinophagaceae bacterium]
MKSSFAKILSLIVISAIVFSCTKNDIKDKLGLNFVSVNKTTFNTSEFVNFKFNFNHPTSGTANDTLLVKRRFLSCQYINKDSFKYVVPEFYATANTLGTFEFNFQYGAGGSYNGCTNGIVSRTDSLYYTFILIDKQNNRSDSVLSPKIILNK